MIPISLFSVSKGTVTLKDSKTGRTYALKVLRQHNGRFDLDVTDVGRGPFIQGQRVHHQARRKPALKA